LKIITKKDVLLKPKDNSRVIVWSLVGLIALTVGGFIIFSIVSKPYSKDELASTTPTTAENTATPTTIEEVLACVCDANPEVCDDPMCYCDPLCNIPD